MEYNCAYNPNLNIIEVSTYGTANMTALLAMQDSIFGLCLQKKSANILVDHSATNASLLTMDDVSAISCSTVSLKDTLRMRKCANVVAEDLQFGFVRAWELMIEFIGFTDIETRIFKNRDEAVEWLKAGF